MTVRIIGKDRKVLGTLQLPASALLADLEALRRFGAQRVEVIHEQEKPRS